MAHPKKKRHTPATLNRRTRGAARSRVPHPSEVLPPLDHADDDAVEKYRAVVSALMQKHEDEHGPPGDPLAAARVFSEIVRATVSDASGFGLTATAASDARLEALKASGWPRLGDLR